ncbi:MAG: TVP38/TMEM64 family protein, partial [Gammaproteobacteria bacterium]|nr:TVP38/TMEM64 family protein [Gammaproteobacteria bacterium]
MQKKIIMVSVLLLTFLLLSLTDAIQYFSIDRLQQWFADEPLQTALIYFGFYVVITAVSFPGAAVVTLLGGA